MAEDSSCLEMCRKHEIPETKKNEKKTKRNEKKGGNSLQPHLHQPHYLRVFQGAAHLVAPYCAIPRDYLSDTPLLRAMGCLVSQHGQLGAIRPPPLLSVSPFENMRSGGAIPPPLKTGISAILARYPMKTRQMGAIPPSAILSRKGIARYGGYLALGR